MISNKEAKSFLSKNNYYKVSKKDVETLQKIPSKAPKTLSEGDLIAKVVYISYAEYINILNKYKNYVGYDELFWEEKNNDIEIETNTLNDANNFQDIIPTVVYLYNYDVKKFKEGDIINLDLNDFMLSFKETEKITEEVSRFIKTIRKDIEFKTEKESYEEYEKKEYDDFISELMSYSSKTPMLISKKKQFTKVIFDLLEKRNRLGNYFLYKIYITEDDLKKIIKKCSEGGDKNKEKLTIKNPNNRFGKSMKKIFFLYLTQRQISGLKDRKITNKTHYLDLSYTQFHKTCFAVVLLNRDIYYYASNGKFPDTPKVKQKLPLLAIEMKNLIDLDGEPIPPVKKKNRTDSTSQKTKQNKTDSTSKKTKQNRSVIGKKFTDFSKDLYKNFTPNQNKIIRNEVINALINEISNPLTKDILNINLTKDLKQKISKLTSEAAIGLTWIIRALVLTNRGKLPVYNYNNSYYHLFKKQIKEIVEYYFTSLSLLLNPAQK